MLKKYLPYILLVAAALLLFFVKKNQRSNKQNNTPVEQIDNRIEVPAVLPADTKDNETEANSDDPVIAGFNRNTEKLIFSKHARCRMDCRKIDESEVRAILKNGTVNLKKIQSDKRGKTYPVEGYTEDKQHVRIVFAPRDDALVVVTVIDLGTEWKCDCK